MLCINMCVCYAATESNMYAVLMLYFSSDTTMKAFFCLYYTQQSVHYLLCFFSIKFIPVNYLNDHIKFARKLFKAPQSD